MPDLQGYYVGLMSGTSVDGIDAVLMKFTANGYQCIASYQMPFEQDLASRIHRLINAQHAQFEEIGAVDVLLADHYALAVQAVLKKAAIEPSDVRAIGSHGQTIAHYPRATTPSTWQLGDPNRLAQKTQIAVVCDFRRKDVALGGQGAPLAPLFHHYMMPPSENDQWILNLGGIANLTHLPPQVVQPRLGFDVGPANTLLDQWCQRHRGHSYDHKGKWAAQGKVHKPLLQVLASDPFFKIKPPKSTGREYFSLPWLQGKLDQCHLTPAIGSKLACDIQATLLALTTQTIGAAINQITAPASGLILWLCGGGAHNDHLVASLKKNEPTWTIKHTAEAGLRGDWVEAAAFAWLAYKTLNKVITAHAQVTGAKECAILGGVYYP